MMCESCARDYQRRQPKAHAPHLLAEKHLYSPRNVLNLNCATSGYNMLNTRLQSRKSNKLGIMRPRIFFQSSEDYGEKTVVTARRTVGNAGGICTGEIHTQTRHIRAFPNYYGRLYGRVVSRTSAKHGQQLRRLGSRNEGLERSPHGTDDEEQTVLRRPHVPSWDRKC